jgi:hypothetical protein
LPVIAISSFASNGVSIHYPQANRFNPERSGWFRPGGRAKAALWTFHRNEHLSSALMFLAGQPRSRALDDQLVILVIEDDQAIQTIVDEALIEGGFEPAIAASGEEAVKVV